jgi:hypothetical protein
MESVNAGTITVSPLYKYISSADSAGHKINELGGTGFGWQKILIILVIVNTTGSGVRVLVLLINVAIVKSLIDKGT